MRTKPNPAAVACEARLATLGVEPCEVRFWARRNGVWVGAGGYLPRRVLAAYEAARATT